MNGAFRIDVSGRDTTERSRPCTTTARSPASRSGRAHEPGREDRRQPLGDVRPGHGLHRGRRSAAARAAARPSSSAQARASRRGPHPEHSAARGADLGAVDGVVTVAGLTCNLPSSKSADINAKFKTGDNVEIRCDFANGAEHADPHREARCTELGVRHVPRRLHSGHVPEHPHPLQLLAAHHRRRGPRSRASSSSAR